MAGAEKRLRARKIFWEQRHLRSWERVPSCMCPRSRLACSPFSTAKVFEEQGKRKVGGSKEDNLWRGDLGPLDGVKSG